MIVKRELSLKVIDNMFTMPTYYYYLNEDVTILTNDNEVFEGKITSIEKLHLSLMDKEEGLVIIKFENIKKQQIQIGYVVLILGENKIIKRGFIYGKGY